MTGRILLMCTVLIGLIKLPVCLANGAEFTSERVELIMRLSNEVLVEVTAIKTELSSNYIYKNAIMWGGGKLSADEIKIPKTVITTIEVQVNKKKLYIPLSAYSDLGAPRQISLKTTKKGFNIIIRGGDASTAYEAWLLFEGTYIKRRKVRHLEFPGIVWQETVYSFWHGDDE